MGFYRVKQEQQQHDGEQETHPTTMFALLHTITRRVVKIQKEILPPVPGNGFFSSSSNNSNSSRSTRSRDKASSTPSTFLLNSLPGATTSPTSPNTILAVLLPLLLEVWEELLSRITRDVNVNGRMFGREVVVGWMRGLEDMLAVCACEGQRHGEEEGEREKVMGCIARSLEMVGEGLKRKIGWVVGMH